MLSGLVWGSAGRVGRTGWRKEVCQQVKCRVNSVTRVVSGYLYPAANQSCTAARPTTCHKQPKQEVEGGSAGAVIHAQEMFRLWSLVQWPHGQGGKIFLLHLSEDVVKSQPSSFWLHSWSNSITSVASLYLYNQYSVLFSKLKHVFIQ